MNDIVLAMWLLSGAIAWLFIIERLSPDGLLEWSIVCFIALPTFLAHGPIGLIMVARAKCA